jgi:hypothetical protein
MPDRDESRDLYVQFMGLEVVHCGGASTVTVGHQERFVRYVPRSDLEAAEREIASLKWQLSCERDRVASLIEAREHSARCVRSAIETLKTSSGIVTS